MLGLYGMLECKLCFAFMWKAVESMSSAGCRVHLVVVDRLMSM